MERPKMAPMLETAIAAGIITEGQARDADAYADRLASQIVSGELTIEQARAQADRDATRDGEAIRRSRARRGLPPISLLSVFLVLAASEAEPEPEPTPPEAELPELAPGSNVEGLRQTVPFDPLWARRNEDVAGATVRQVRLAALRASERGFTAATLQARPNWHAPTHAGALIRTAVKWGLIQ